MSIDEDLLRLRKSVVADPPIIQEVLDALEPILIWLSENNTNENCRLVDLFVTTEIEPSIRSRLPKDVASILFDMGGALHDTHTAPEIARDFYSTPEQLLARLRAVHEANT